MNSNRRYQEKYMLILHPPRGKGGIQKRSEILVDKQQQQQQQQQQQNKNVYRSILRRIIFLL